MTSLEPKSCSTDSRDDIFYWLVNNHCDINHSAPESEGCVQYTLSFRSDRFYTRSIFLFRRWITLLKNEDYDLERRNFSGETTLLSHAASRGGYSTEAVLLLLQNGADPGATNLDGHNALVCAMTSIKAASERFRYIVQQKLMILIRAGCQIDQRDKDGFTPSFHALKNQCWYEWCSALEINGIDFGPESLADRPCHAALLSTTDWESFQLPVNKDLSSKRLELLFSPKSIAVNPYSRWNRRRVLTFIYFWACISSELRAKCVADSCTRDPWKS